VKFGSLLAIVTVAAGVIIASVLMSTAGVRETNTRLTDLWRAENLVLQLDTRASELKVDGYKAAVRQVPAEQLTELADDIATPQEMLAELRGIPLTGDAAEAVAALEASYGEYVVAISAYVDTAVADQAAARLRWEEIQAANDLTDGAVGEAKDVLAAEAAVARADLAAALDRTDTTSILVAGVSMLVVAAACWLIARAITVPVARVRATLEALAAGDLTATTGVRQDDEIGRMAGALDVARRACGR
jgi:methyl-accepting chemotaxis protein